MAVTVTQLVAFVTVARRGSVTAAAEELVVTQPSVSSAIAALQRELGVTLMERDGRRLRPSPAGRAYLPYANEVMALLGQGARAAREAEAQAPTLRVAAVTTAGEQLLAPLLRPFREAHPELEIMLHVGNRADVFARLLDHDVDVAITGRPPEELALAGHRFAANPFVLITEPGDPLGARRSVAVQELADRHWLLREPGSGTRAMCEEFLAGHGLQPQVLTLGSNGAIKQAASLGLGVGVMSASAVQLELELGKLTTIRLRGGLPERAWYVVRPAGGPVRAEVRAFVEFLGSAAARHVLGALGS